MPPVTIPLVDLADALGTTPEGLKLALELAERLGAVRLDEGRVEMGSGAADRPVREGERKGPPQTPGARCAPVPVHPLSYRPRDDPRYKAFR